MKKPPYPKQYSDKIIYIKAPEESNGKWFCVNVLENGKTTPEAIYKPYEGEHSCQIICNSHNEFHNYSKAQVKIILKRIGYVKH